jgi:hypothetical protein
MNDTALVAGGFGWDSVGYLWTCLWKGRKTYPFR